MSYKYNIKLDKLIGHDYPGEHHNGFYQYEIDELELGARVAMAIDDPDPSIWELYGRQIEMDLRK